jgi:2-keto-4-pentenoate hydratase/2-oxohepta-3-ene-1,7-dioic acid hydratase in catechol pathway
MRIVSFASAGRASYGVVSGDKVIDVGRSLAARYPTLRSAIAADALGEIADCARSGTADLALDAVTLLPPIPDPEKIICIGLNYRAHAAEAGREVPPFPSLFLRLANTLVPHGGALIRPRASSDMDYEGELAVIIGRGGRHIGRDDAMAHIAGYACFNDGSLRDFQLEHSLAVGKNFFATGGFGPWMVTADEVPDPGQLGVTTRLNGRQVQHGNTNDFIFDLPYIIAYCSAFTPLSPGDVIATGTPEGVGFVRKPPLWMKPGDVVEVEIAGVGVLRNTVAAEG